MRSSPPSSRRPRAQVQWSRWVHRKEQQSLLWSLGSPARRQERLLSLSFHRMHQLRDPPPEPTQPASSPRPINATSISSLPIERNSTSLSLIVTWIELLNGVSFVA